MKKTIILTLLSLLGSSVSFAGPIIKKNGIVYEKTDNGTARAYLTQFCSYNVDFLEKVVILGKEYLVTEIDAAKFKKNHLVKAVTIPSSVVTISDYAFNGCANLSKVVFPDGYYTIGKDAFYGCNNITDIQGNIIPCVEAGSLTFSAEKTQSEYSFFSTYAKDKLKELMEDWQTKKNYESVDMYKARVTEENRRIRQEEFRKELEEEYVELFAPKEISTFPVKYDRDYEVYTIRTDFWGYIYVKVPKSDANNFKQNYKSVNVVPHFGVKGDTLSILSCDFIFNGKTYNDVPNYEDNGTLDYQFDLPPLDIDQALAVEENKRPERKSIDRSIDRDIPVSKAGNDKTFVLIIGNEKYKRISEVPYATNDANVFAEYCQKTLGIPKSNIQVYTDATVNDMRHAVQTLTNKLQAFKGEARALVYYSGHGYPDEASKMPYLMPVDGYATDVAKTGYNLNDAYDELAAAPSQLTLFFIDACFSGTQRDGDMVLAAKGMVMAARSTVPTGNILVFSASQGTETAFVDEEHGHGRFTYYLLKHLRDTKGNTTLGGLVDYVKDQVLKASVIENDGKTQTPTPNPSFSLGDNWKNMKLR